MNLEAIQDAILRLSGPERRQLCDWFAELREADWDRQMESDLSPGGCGVHLIEAIDCQIAVGAFAPLEQGLRERRDQRTKK